MDTSRGRPEPLGVTWQVEIVDGEEGGALACRQTQVMLEVPAWITEQRRGQGSPATFEQD